AVLVQVLNAEPVPPRTLRADVDHRLEAICRKAMAKKPADRFRGMTDLAAALTDYLQAGQPTPPVGRQRPEQPSSATFPVPATAQGRAPVEDPFASLTAADRDGPRRRRSRSARQRTWAVLLALALVPLPV